MKKSDFMNYKILLLVETNYGVKKNNDEKRLVKLNYSGKVICYL